jgi:hypothetical protein
LKKIIVTTTINPPTQAIRKFDALDDWELVVIGDRKTPNDYSLARGLYMSPESQDAYNKDFSDALGWNCIQRRNFGFLVAHDRGADVIAVVDDDNIPLPGWGEELSVGREVEVNYYETELPAFDPVGATNYPHLWHRGFPIQLLPKRDYRRVSKKRVLVDIQADFWNGDPDIDAICRMEHAPVCDFDPARFPISASKPSPFNSQNTFLSRKVLCDYFLFPDVGRMDDIWASYYAQAKGWRVVYCKASVFQDRNEHDLIVDMKKEYLGYENNLRIVNDRKTMAESIVGLLSGRSKAAFRLYTEMLSV